MVKMVFFEVNPEEEKKIRHFLGADSADLAFTEEKLNQKSAAAWKDAEVVSVFVNSEVSREALSGLPRLRFIAARSTGFDHIDLEYAKQKKILVSNVPSYGSRTVAEFTFGLILNLSRRIFEARHQLLEGDDFSIRKLQGFDLQGKTLGVIGTGRIGRNVIRIAKGFEMEVLAYDIIPDKQFAKEMGFSYLDLDQLLSNADIITLHAPYTEKTHHLLNGGNFKLIKKGALVINTARGELIETEALLRGLKNGDIGGAGLDVLESERDLKEEIALLGAENGRMRDFRVLFQNQVLLDLPQVVVTPHIAFCSQEAVEEILCVTAENIQCFLAGKPQNLV